MDALVRLRLAALATAALVVAGLPALPATASDRSSAALSVEVVSSRADVVSGGDARVVVDVPDGVAPGSVTLRAGSRDVTAALAPGADGGQLEGVVTGLREGPSVLRASAPGATPATLRVVNHPLEGPVFAGPHQQPFVCETAEFRTAGGGLLGEPTDADCSVPTRVEHVYRTTGGSFAPLADPAQVPPDTAVVTLDDGRTVPFVVRVETGVVNRGIYETATLQDVTTGAAAPQPVWNGDLVYTFGGGCRAGWYVQGRATGGVLVPSMLERGYAVTSSSLNVFGQNCSDLLSAETFSMTRERFVETYGRPAATIGWGCSGGSYQAQQIADGYPGMLDGIVVGCSFADVGFATAQKLADSRLLQTYATETAPGALSPEQLQAVSGFGTAQALPSMSDGAARLDPDAEFDASVPAELRYDAETNPTGARATIWDHTVNAYGLDPATGFARQPVDNVGVQYGLGAVQDGVVSVDQFLDLNARIGGLDVDAEPQAQRSVADPVAVENAYATGRLTDTGLGLADIPIIDYRSYTDALPTGDIHMRYHSFAIRDRLVAANGDADNQVMLVEGPEPGLFEAGTPVLVEALDQMSQWVHAVRAADADAAAGTDRHDLVVAAKPQSLQEACWTPEGEKVVEEQTHDGPGRCNELFPSFASPRVVAGGPLASDVVACDLRPLDAGEYGVPLTAEQTTRLAQVFPDGVCDWTRPGRGTTDPAGPWLTYDGPGSYAPLGPPPTSRP